MTYRVERVNNLIRQELSDLFQREVKDPRLDTFVAITDVVTSPDLRHARVFVSRIGSEAEKHEILGALTAAAGFLRNELAKRLRLRHIPELSFQWDDSIERGDHILQLLDRIHSEDNQEQSAG
ncbi:MAG: 30S ribosome-binding factor RbfA [Dehalococcoidales bacterium]|nr:30S ribosome-binding factor RbfA [Dehalococcoidales bacterium]